jgi:hypothetical protein
MCGVRSEMRSKSSMSSSTPISVATASRCRTPLVEPPEAVTAAIAFSSEALVIRSLGRRPARRTSMTRRPASKAASPLLASWAGTADGPIGLMPNISKAIAIVLAVNCPPHAPTPGLAASVISSSSASVILPAAWAPTASKTSRIEMSRPW